MVYRIFFALVWIGMTSIRIPHANIYKKTEKKRAVQPEVEKFLTTLNFIGMGLLPLTFVVIPSGIFRLPLPDWVAASGLGVLAASLVIFYLVHKQLGRNWSPILEIRQEHNLITSGIYKYIRHPMYTQLWIWVVFQGLALRNWLVMIFGIVAWSLLYFIRVPVEEGMLADEFKEEYTAYKQRTGRVFPKLRQRPSRAS